MVNCLRCGRCCYYFLDGKRKKCPFLITLKSNKTLCRSYKTRVGRKVAISKDGKTFFFCIPFDATKDPYKSVCPLVINADAQNKPKKPELDPDQ